MLVELLLVVLVVLDIQQFPVVDSVKLKQGEPAVPSQPVSPLVTFIVPGKAQILTERDAPNVIPTKSYTVSNGQVRYVKFTIPILENSGGGGPI